MKCRRCGSEINYEEKYCQSCIDFLAATDKLSYSELWKYKVSGGGCIGCISISGGDRNCENCTRSHTYEPPYQDLYRRS